MIAVQPDLPGHKLEPVKSLRVLGRRRDVGMAFAAKAHIAGLHGEKIMISPCARWRHGVYGRTVQTESRRYYKTYPVEPEGGFIHGR